MNSEGTSSHGLERRYPSPRHPVCQEVVAKKGVFETQSKTVVVVVAVVVIGGEYLKSLFV